MSAQICIQIVAPVASTKAPRRVVLVVIVVVVVVAAAPDSLWQALSYIGSLALSLNKVMAIERKLCSDNSQFVVTSLSLISGAHFSNAAYVPLGTRPFNSILVMCDFDRKCLAKWPCFLNATSHSGQPYGLGLSEVGIPKACVIVKRASCAELRLCFSRRPVDVRSLGMEGYAVSVGVYVGLRCESGRRCHGCSDNNMIADSALFSPNRHQQISPRSPNKRTPPKYESEISGSRIITLSVE